MKKNEENNFPILAVVLLAIFVPASLLEGRAAHIFWAIIIGLIVVFVGVVILSIKLGLRPDDGTRIGKYVYFDYDKEPGIWAHNDALYAFKIIRIDKLKLKDVLQTDKGWEIESFSETDPEGSCCECKERTEIRKNGLTFHYYLKNWQNCWWYEKHDLVRMLFDKRFYVKIMNRAEHGDDEAQTLVACCMAHNGKMGQHVVKHGINAAVLWWKFAANKGNVYAMRELAIYYWHLGKKEEAFQWNEKSGNLCWVITRYHQAAILDAQRKQEENKESATDSKV